MNVQSREISKLAKYQDLCHAVDMSFLQEVFGSHGLVGQRFLEHFDKLIVRRVDKIGALVAPKTLSSAAA